MRTHVTIGTTRTLALRYAVLVYGPPHGDAYRFATLHVPLVPEDGASPVLGPGEPLSSAFLRALAEGLGTALPTEILPAHVLTRTADTVVWWTPPAVRPMFFDAAGPALAAVSGRRFPHPALVWKLHGRALSLRALATDTRPDAATPLAVAPYYNTGADGLVCQGNMPAPDRVTLDTLDAWERAYFGSAFTHVAGVVRLTRHPDGFVGLWTSLADQPGSFPVAHLADAGQTLRHFVEADR